MSVCELEPELPAPGVELTKRGREDTELPPGDRDLTRVWRVLGALVVAACCGLVLWQLNPGLLLRDTTPSGGDMGAHVWFPAFLRDHLLPSFRVAGWSPDWFGGFPAGQFYFPLPALLIVALDVLMPYNVAFKLVTALGPVALPAAAYAFGRGLRVRRPGPELFAVAAVLFLFFKGVDAAPGSHDATIQFNQRIMGGTLVSALAGEYSFSLALAFALVFLGALAWSLDTRRRLWLPAVLLAATVLSHVVVGIFAVIGAVVIVAFRLRASRGGRTITLAAAIGLVGALLTAFWSVPLLATFAYTANMRYEKLTWYLDYLFLGELWWVFVLAVIGAVIGMFRRDRAVLTIVTVTATFGLVFRLWPELHAWNLRFLPFWYLGVFLLAAIVVAEVVRGVAQLAASAWVGASAGADGEPEPAADARRFRLVKTLTATGLVVALAAGGLFAAQWSRGFLDFWAEWNYSGYEDASASSDKPKVSGEYRALVNTMSRLPAGRAMWEGGQSLDAYGTPLALMLLPYWTHGRITSLEGLYYESAASTPYDFMAVAAVSGPGNSSNPVRGLDYRTIEDFSLGVRYLRALGVRYYLAHSHAAKTAADTSPELRPVARVRNFDHAPPESWKVYELRGYAAVAALPYEPVVVDPVGGTQSECFGRSRPSASADPHLDPWECTAAGWWNDPHTLDHPLAANGPAAWVHTSVDRARTVPPRRLPSVTVRDIHETTDSISFRVSRTGVPVVVRTSYFPNWTADGARGPWRLTPNLMVVVPTSTTVSLHYDRSGPEWVGTVLSVLGVVGLAGLVVWGRKPRSRRNHQKRRNRGSARRPQG